MTNPKEQTVDRLDIDAIDRPDWWQGMVNRWKSVTDDNGELKSPLGVDACICGVIVQFDIPALMDEVKRLEGEVFSLKNKLGLLKYRIEDIANLADTTTGEMKRCLQTLIDKSPESGD